MRSSLIGAALDVLRNRRRERPQPRRVTPSILDLVYDAEAQGPRPGDPVLVHQRNDGPRTVHHMADGTRVEND